MSLWPGATRVVALILGIHGVAAADPERPLGAAPVASVGLLPASTGSGSTAPSPPGLAAADDTAASTEPPGEPGLPEIHEAAEGLYVEFGRGVVLRSADGDSSVTLRGRIQTRATLRDVGATDPDLWFQVRRARLVLLGDNRDHHLQFYLQLGLGASDLEERNTVPLRDAQIIWSRMRDLSFRVGQMKVPFNRERVVSSSALQFADRSRANAEFNLDRDVGVQLFSNDLLGLDGLLAYQIGAYGGAGRNRVAPGPSVLGVARLSVQPLGLFPDLLTEADLRRERRARLSLGASVAHSPRAQRARVTHGADLVGPGWRTRHLATDMIFKWAGLSIQAEYLYRGAERRAVERGQDEEGRFATGHGAVLASGYVFASGVEVAARATRLWSDSPHSALGEGQALAACLGHYVVAHDLKLQLDYERFASAIGPVEQELRLQAQVFF